MNVLINFDDKISLKILITFASHDKLCVIKFVRLSLTGLSIASEIHIRLYSDRSCQPLGGKSPHYTCSIFLSEKDLDLPLRSVDVLSTYLLTTHFL